MLAYHIMVEKQRAAGQLGQTPVQLTPTQVKTYAFQLRLQTSVEEYNDLFINLGSITG